MPAPDTNPAGRDPATVAPMSAYRPGNRVWVYRVGAWRPGRIVELSRAAALVRYRPTKHRGAGVDTVLPADLAPREDVDEFLDGLGESPVS